MPNDAHRLGSCPVGSASACTNSESRQAVLAGSIAKEELVQTLIHEAAHIGVHHIDDVEEYRAHRTRTKVEGETVARLSAASPD